MNLTPVAMTGTLRPDGTLVLDQKPALPPGRVRLVMQPLPEDAAKQDWWPLMQRLRAEREVAGYRFMTEAEMREHLDWLHEDDDRIDRIYRQMETEGRKQAAP